MFGSLLDIHTFGLNFTAFFNLPKVLKCLLWLANFYAAKWNRWVEFHSISNPPRDPGVLTSSLIGTDTDLLYRSILRSPSWPHGIRYHAILLSVDCICEGTYKGGFCYNPVGGVKDSPEELPKFLGRNHC